MKPKDVWLERWEAVVAQKRDATAIFNTGNKGARTFRQIDDRARDFEPKINSLHAGNVLAVQIGNHQDWPSILIACLRRGVVVLPLEQSISEQQRDSAFKICNVVATAVSGGSSTEILPMRSPSRTGTSAATTSWKNNRPSLLKLTSG